MRLVRSVVGWNGSAASNAALDWAADRESRRGGAVHLVLVLDEGGRGDPASRVNAVCHSLQDATATLGRRYPTLEVSAEIAIGDPAEDLARIAGRDSLLVVGAARGVPEGSRMAGPVPFAVVERPVGATAVVPSNSVGGGSGVVVVVRSGPRSAGPLSFAAQAASDLDEPLTVVRVRDPDVPPGDRSAGLGPALATIARDLPALTVTVDPGSVRSPVGLLARCDGAMLLVLEGHGPTADPPRSTLERWLAGLAGIPFAVVAEAVVRSDPRHAPEAVVARRVMGR